jgi:cytochrome oxidase Cu insertion factor (SCO1/SenC/PrrC family)
VTRAARASLVLLLVASAAVVSGASPPDLASLRIQPYDPPKPAPAFSLPDLSGKPWTLAEARGKVVLLFFWASW